MELDGIGETLASRIIEYREQHGGFDSVEELMEVKGIGEKRFERYGTISRLGDTRQKPPSGGFCHRRGKSLVPDG